MNVVIAGMLFVLSQLVFYLWSEKSIGSNSKMDGSFVATVLETASVFMVYLFWESITDGKWCAFMWDGSDN